MKVQLNRCFAIRPYTATQGHEKVIQDQNRSVKAMIGSTWTVDTHGREKTVLH